MLQPIDLQDDKLKYPGYYNIYPILNEVSVYGKLEKALSSTRYEFKLDDNYGRVISSYIPSIYGHSEVLPYHLKDFPEYLIGEIRVPMRKIPIYKFQSHSQIQPFIDSLITRYPDNEILLRGQTKIYTLDRSIEEKKFLYGQGNVIEPSLLPSFARLDFDEFFIYNLWHSLTAMMLDDIAIDMKSILLATQLEVFKEDVKRIKLHPHFTFIALGIAQHYGLPSVGLDLTKDLKVASWFATHQMKTSNGLTAIHPASNLNDSTIFVFSCPKDQVFSHERIKPKFVNDTRPDRQNAWFCHTGWGYAKNQIAENMICAIRLDSSVWGNFDASYHRTLFPSRDKDLMLNFFLDFMENRELKGETKRAFERIYRLYDLHI